MTYSSSKTEQLAKQLGVSPQVLEQYLRLKRVEVMAEAAPPAPPRPIKGEAGTARVPKR